MFFYAIRGAITVDENKSEDILENTRILLETVIERNKIKKEEIVSIIFSGTKDLDSVYPAVAARSIGMTDIPLFCCQEMYVKGSLEKCIRLIMHLQSPDKQTPKHVYLKGAKSLRPDLTSKTDFISPSGQKKPNDIITIAIDGPAGAGKSTIAKNLSKELKINYLDTGAMYRGLALKMLKMGIGLQNPKEVIMALAKTDLEVKFSGDNQLIILDGEDVSSQIRENRISKAASEIALIPEVRIKLVEIQRNIAMENSLVMDGRDIGTFVLPNASLKFFLTASLEERARRRWEEIKAKGTGESLDLIMKEINARDISDTSRKFAPLKPAEDALIIDSTFKSVKEVSDLILSHVNKRLKNDGGGGEEYVLHNN